MRELAIETAEENHRSPRVSKEWSKGEVQQYDDDDLAAGVALRGDLGPPGDYCRAPSSEVLPFVQSVKPQTAPVNVRVKVPVHVSSSLKVMLVRL